ncbi:MAG: hypothetical protein F6K62_17855 [Sphaerospermopsis sp. SIO1G2]|nr:hypothetical protein [Sphaerospermopsis sp. SIO1G1]NET72719.1 hypothetical protein [Sphaerospermopsis sp. SIO1G2]
MVQENKKGRGRPSGIPREGKYGTGKKTKVVRVPVEVADNIPEILDKFEQIKCFVDSWDYQIEMAAQSSSKGKPSPRYDKAMDMLSELRKYLG